MPVTDVAVLQGDSSFHRLGEKAD